MTPTMIPTFVMSFVSTRPVEEAMAFGGVEIGKSIAIEAQTAMKLIIAVVPPSATNEALFAADGSAIPPATTIRIGMSRAAVVELLMKFDRKYQTKPATTSTNTTDIEPNGSALIKAVASPVP